MLTRELKALLTTALATVLFAGSAFAVVPDSGWYFNPGEAGRGFNIEIQNNTLFMAGFMYDSAGHPIWVISGGTMSSDRTYSGAAFQTANGQPLGGAPRAATGVPFGTASVTFPTTTTANITVNGYTFSVTREQFGFDFTSTTEPLLGEFAFVIGNASFPVYFGQRISFTSTQLLNGSTYAVGNMTGNSGASYLAVGNYVPSLGQWTVLLDSSPSYWQYYVFKFEGMNLIEGTASTYLKGSLPDAGLNVIGNRIKSAQAAAGGNAPGVIRTMALSTTRVGTNSTTKAGTDTYAAATVSAQTPQQLPPEQIDVLHQLESVLQGIRQ